MYVCMELNKFLNVRIEELQMELRGMQKDQEYNIGVLHGQIIALSGLQTGLISESITI